MRIFGVENFTFLICYGVANVVRTTRITIQRKCYFSNCVKTQEPNLKKKKKKSTGNQNVLPAYRNVFCRARVEISNLKYQNCVFCKTKPGKY